MPFFLLLLLLALSVYGAETSIARYAHYEHGMLTKEYDMEGGRAYWINGISVMGLPDAGAGVMGFSEPAKRLPLGFSGLYAPPPIYERYGLSLNASNGSLIFKENFNPIDTPVTSLLWERYGLEGNAFTLNFNRLFLDSVAFSLGLASHMVPLSDNFIYQDIVNQFYIGTLKRDSTKVPMTGRNLAYNSFHFVPAISWIFPNSSITAQTSFLWLDNDDATRDFLVKDPITYLIDFPQRPYKIKGGANFYRLLWNYRFLPDWELNFSHRYATQELNYSRLNAKSIYFPTEVLETYNAQTGEGKISHKSLLNPYIDVRYEYLRSKDYLPEVRFQERGAIPLYQDRQLVLLGINDTLWRFALRGQSGLQRNASFFDSVDVTPSLHTGITVFLPWHLQYSYDYQKDTRFPDIQETHILRVGRIAFPNSKLKPEKRKRTEMNFTYKLNENVFYGIGYRQEKSENAIMPFWAIPKRWYGSLPADSAFKWANAEPIESRDLFLRLGFELGNWRFYAEKGENLSRTSMIDIPLIYYKGAVYWSNRFVQDRLKVSVLFDADWFGGRWNYALENDNIANPAYLNNYLSLNFKSSMQIQNFILYAKIDNMNNSLMEPETGYTPPGVRFAYGIEWKLWD
ncbi:MAG: hypothetical protein LBC64_00180 [Fibromonadaceae bacterium]|jgi:hypothetical protein|nr:hypothetical protein [Fibromonadaceae bacterium]